MDHNLQTFFSDYILSMIVLGQRKGMSNRKQFHKYCKPFDNGKNFCIFLFFSFF
jgi:hypothetical protein